MQIGSEHCPLGNAFLSPTSEPKHLHSPFLRSAYGVTDELALKREKNQASGRTSNLIILWTRLLASLWKCTNGAVRVGRLSQPKRKSISYSLEENFGGTQAGPVLLFHTSLHFTEPFFFSFFFFWSECLVISLKHDCMCHTCAFSGPAGVSAISSAPVPTPFVSDPSSL